MLFKVFYLKSTVFNSLLRTNPINVFNRNRSSEFVANVTETSVVVSVDGLGRYNASVSSWTRLGNGGLLIYITFSTVESGECVYGRGIIIFRSH